MVVMESLTDREAISAAQKSSWYEPSAEDYLKASNNSYFSQMTSYHSMTHPHQGKHN
jgi:hypothetical protein